MPNKLFAGDLVTCRKAKAAEALSDGADDFGDSIDRSGFLSGKIHVATGAITGGPSAQTVDVRLQDSADGSAFADFADPVTGVVVTVPQVDAADSEAEVAVNLLGARQFIRTATDVVLTGGSAPTIIVAPLFVLGGADVEPAS